MDFGLYDLAYRDLSNQISNTKICDLQENFWSHLEQFEVTFAR